MGECSRKRVRPGRFLTWPVMLNRRLESLKSNFHPESQLFRISLVGVKMLRAVAVAPVKTKTGRIEKKPPLTFIWPQGFFFLDLSIIPKPAVCARS
jgi:hypothetical protein